MLSKKILILSCVIAVVMSFFYYTQLPEKVAVHFNSAGIADGWASRTVNLLTWVFLYLFMSSMYLLLPRLIKNMPVKYVGMPNKGYWLSPERVDSTVKTLSNFLSWFGVGMNIFLMSIEAFSFKANIYNFYALNVNIIRDLIIAFFCFTVFWIIKLYLTFKLPKDYEF